MYPRKGNKQQAMPASGTPYTGGGLCYWIYLLKQHPQHTNQMINITLVYGTSNSINLNLVDGTTMGQVLGNSANRAALGYGTNVEGHIASVPQNDNTRLVDGDRVYIYDRQCGKAAGVTRVTVQYGTGNTFTRDYDHPVTVSEVLSDGVMRSRLGYGASVEGHLGGQPMPGHIVLADGDVLHVFDKQCGKAQIA